MKIKLKSNLFGKSIGDTIEVGTGVGESLIKSGDAVAAKANRKKLSNKALSAKAG